MLFLEQTPPPIIGIPDYLMRSYLQLAQIAKERDESRHGPRLSFGDALPIIGQDFVGMVREVTHGIRFIVRNPLFIPRVLSPVRRNEDGKLRFNAQGFAADLLLAVSALAACQPQPEGVAAPSPSPYIRPDGTTVCIYFWSDVGGVQTFGLAPRANLADGSTNSTADLLVQGDLLCAESVFRLSSIDPLQSVDGATALIPLTSDAGDQLLGIGTRTQGEVSAIYDIYRFVEHPEGLSLQQIYIGVNGLLSPTGGQAEVSPNAEGTFNVKTAAGERIIVNANPAHLYVP